MTLIIDIHALQTVPPSLINRDENGAPKTAVFGGVPRQRVSSQAWKHAIRKFFGKVAGAESIGKRSRNLPEVIIKKAMEISPELSEADAVDRLKNLFEATAKNKKEKGISLEVPKKYKDDAEGDAHSYPTTEALLFLSPQQIERAARAIVEKGDEKFTKSEAQDILDTAHTIDMAMFGRMLAGAPNYNIDAAVQVAHAIGVHESEPEFDYFTAVDDVTKETGAAMIGNVQMMSSTLYRFASVNVEALAENLGDAEAARQAVALFVQAFIKSIPSGKQNTFANNTLPELVYVAVRDTRSVSLVNAFEEPVASEQGGRVHAAVEALAKEEAAIEEA